MSCLFADPDPRGNWKLSGLSVDYLHIARETTPFYLTVDYPNLAGTSFATDSDCGEAGSASICVHLLDIPAGVMFNRLTNGPFTNTGLGGIGVNLNINVYDGGHGTIAQGSFYPDIELSESQDCVTDLQIFSVNENFSWELGTQTTFSDANVLGMPDGLLCGDDDPNTVANECTGLANTDEAWGFGLVTGLFDETPSTPVPVALPPGLPYIALTDGTVLGASCQTALVGAACGALGYDLGGGTYMAGDCPSADTETDQDSCTTDCVTALTIAGSYDAVVANVTACEMATNPAYGGTYAGSAAFGGAGWLHGTGTSSKFNLDAGASAMCDTPNCNPDVDFLLVWDAIDSQESGLGFGDIDYPADGWDEDGDGSEFDRIFGVPYISVTKVNTSNPLCDVTGGGGGDAWNYPLAGDIVASLGETQGCDALPTYAEQYGCGAAVVDAFITDNCFNSVLSGVEAGCLAQVAAGVEGGCLDAALAGTIAQCEGDGTGTPAAFATGLCADAAGSDDLQAVCNADASVGGGWENAVIGLCMGLDIDAATCAAAASGADGIFENYCQTTYSADCDTVSASLGATVECSLLDDATFAAGACGAVVGGLIAETDCTVWAADLSDSFLNSAAEASSGADCPTTAANLAAGLAADDAGAIAALNGMALGATGADCPTTAATLAAGYGAENAGAIAALDDMAAGALGISCTSYGDIFVPTCLETAGEYNGDNDTEMYLFKPGAGLDTWGDFMTFNAASFSAVATQAATGPIPCGDAGLVAFPGSHPTGDWDGDGDGPDAGDIAAFTGYCNPHLVVNDFDHDFDEACLYDGDPSDCSGRLRMTFEPTCVPEIEARQIVAEFSDLSALCNHSGDVDYSCSAYDWNYSTLADTDGDGVDAADCEAYATATGQAYVVNNYGVLPSCDADDGLTENCTEYSATVVWNSAYNMCGDGDPNDLIYLGPEGFCALAVPTGAFGDPANPATMPTCLGYYDTVDGGIPSFEQSCTVGDGNVTVTDVVRIINHIIGNDSSNGQSVDQLGGEAACEADVNNDGNINVVDVVQIVNGILSGNGKIADATEASISIENDKIVVNADGYIGAVDMIVELTDNSSFDLADNFAGTYSINGNKAHIIVIGDENGVSEVLTMTSGKIIGIEEALVANSSDFVTTSINQPSIFSVGAAYPNPFNPSTNISLVLNANADLSVKIYNLTGQLVDVIAEGNYSPSSYNWTWKADNLASGVYFIKTQVGSDVSTQKVMLLK